MDLEDKRLSPTTIKIYLTLLKVIINYAKKHNMVKYEIEPLEFCRMPSANIRELELTIDEVKAIRDMEIQMCIRDRFNSDSALNISFRTKDRCSNFEHCLWNHDDYTSCLLYTSDNPFDLRDDLLFRKHISRKG